MSNIFKNYKKEIEAINKIEYVDKYHVTEENLSATATEIATKVSTTFGRPVYVSTKEQVMFNDLYHEVRWALKNILQCTNHDTAYNTVCRREQQHVDITVFSPQVHVDYEATYLRDMPWCKITPFKITVENEAPHNFYGGLALFPKTMFWKKWLYPVDYDYETGHMGVCLDWRDNEDYDEFRSRAADDFAAIEWVNDDEARPVQKDELKYLSAMIGLQGYSNIDLYM
jgi:hypothetical protein